MKRQVLGPSLCQAFGDNAGALPRRGVKTGGQLISSVVKLTDTQYVVIIQNIARTYSKNCCYGSCFNIHNVTSSKIK